MNEDEHGRRDRVLVVDDSAETLGFIADALEAEGLVERTPDPVDRRVKRIVLTPSGMAALDALGPARQLLSDRLFAALDATELDQLTALLERLNTRLLDLEQEDDTAAHVSSKR